LGRVSYDGKYATHLPKALSFPKLGVESKYEQIRRADFYEFAVKSPP
jgi:hypothetical protein